jgi:Zn-dependent M28 family amino/carboxypeptidase
VDHAKTGTIGRAVTAKLAINEADYPTRNVIAVIPGSDSTLKNEYVALGAHSDHLGISTRPLEHDSVRAYAIETQRRRREGGQTSSVRANVDSLRRIRAARPDSIYNGADDDGSGSVALLEIAERFAAARQHPRRSLLFVWHAAEEMGLVGSGWFTDHPTVPLDSVIAQLNLDMVGRGDASDLRSGGPRYLEVIGSGRRSSALHDAIEAVNTASESPLSLNTLDPNGVFCRSDHWSYARFGIPIAFFTTGPHADYHQVTDEAQYIDYAKLERVTQFVSEVARALADTSAHFEPLGKRPVFAPFCTGR